MSAWMRFPTSAPFAAAALTVLLSQGAFAEFRALRGLPEPGLRGAAPGLRGLDAPKARASGGWCAADLLRQAALLAKDARSRRVLADVAYLRSQALKSARGEPAEAACAGRFGGGPSGPYGRAFDELESLAKMTIDAERGLRESDRELATLLTRVAERLAEARAWSRPGDRTHPEKRRIVQDALGLAMRALDEAREARLRHEGSARRSRERLRVIAEAGRTASALAAPAAGLSELLGQLSSSPADAGTAGPSLPAGRQAPR